MSTHTDEFLIERNRSVLCMDYIYIYIYIYIYTSIIHPIVINVSKRMHFDDHLFINSPFSGQ